MSLGNRMAVQVSYWSTEKIVMEREISWLPRCVRGIYIIPAAEQGAWVHRSDLSLSAYSIWVFRSTKRWSSCIAKPTMSRLSVPCPYHVLFKDSFVSHSKFENAFEQSPRGGTVVVMARLLCLTCFFLHFHFGLDISPMTINWFHVLWWHWWHEMIE